MCVCICANFVLDDPEQKLTSKLKMKTNCKLPSIDPKSNSFIPPTTPTNGLPDSKLPPICISTRTEFKYAEVNNDEKLLERLQTQQLKFMIQRNFYVLVKIVKCKLVVLLRRCRKSRNAHSFDQNTELTNPISMFRIFQ